MEMTLSLFAWLGVIVIQVMVHVYIRTKREKPYAKDAPPLEASPLVLESLAQLDEDSQDLPRCATTMDDDAQKDDNMSTAKTESIQSMDSMDECDLSQQDLHCFDISDDLSIDGDEPRMFFVLLSQTGSEMMKVCCLKNLSVYIVVFVVSYTLLGGLSSCLELPIHRASRARTDFRPTATGDTMIYETLIPSKCLTYVPVCPARISDRNQDIAAHCPFVSPRDHRDLHSPPASTVLATRH